MIELFTSTGARDFRQRYEGTVGWVIGESGKKTLVNVESVRDRQVLLKHFGPKIISRAWLTLQIISIYLSSIKMNCYLVLRN